MRESYQEFLRRQGVGSADVEEQSLVCGYCLLPVSEESSVTIGQSEVPLCHDSEYSCYELVTVYGRPLADGRRVGRFTMTKGQLLLPDMP